MFEQHFKNIDDVLWKDAGVSNELDYIEQTSLVLFQIPTMPQYLPGGVFQAGVKTVILFFEKPVLTVASGGASTKKIKRAFSGEL